MQGATVLRTPETRFQNLKDYPFQAHYAMIDGMRMHYVDENPGGSPVIVMLHGEPTWSYLYRNIIPTFVARGFRVIAPDLIGFGKSDKPTDKKSYSYIKSVEWLEKFLFDHLQLQTIHLVVHDWGGLIGLRVVANHPHRFATVVAMNTTLPRLEGVNPLFMVWRLLCGFTASIPYASLIPIGMRTKPDKEMLAGYDAPFPSKTYKTAALRFPKLVPVYPWDQEAWKNREAWRKLGTFEKPFLTIFSENDPFSKRVEKHFIKHVPGAKNQAHVKVKNAGHLIQEDQPQEVCDHILTFIAKNS